VREISLHILDLVQNSISAAATEIRIELVENLTADIFELHIIDNGRGMTAEQVLKVTDPFYTTRETRPVGFGVPFFKATVESSGGKLQIESTPGEGTKISARMQHRHLNRPPLGNITETLQMLIMSNPAICFYYKHQVNENIFEFNSQELSGFINEFSGIDFAKLTEMKNYIEAHIRTLYEGINKIE